MADTSIKIDTTIDTSGLEDAIDTIIAQLGEKTSEVADIGTEIIVGMMDGVVNDPKSKNAIAQAGKEIISNLGITMAREESPFAKVVSTILPTLLFALVAPGAAIGQTVGAGILAGLGVTLAEVNFGDWLAPYVVDLFEGNSEYKPMIESAEAFKQALEEVGAASETAGAAYGEQIDKITSKQQTVETMVDDLNSAMRQGDTTAVENLMSALESALSGLQLTHEELANGTEFIRNYNAELANTEKAEAAQERLNELSDEYVEAMTKRTEAQEEFSVVHQKR